MKRTDWMIPALAVGSALFASTVVVFAVAALSWKVWPDGVWSFLGNLAGPALGLFGLLGGALYNAKLARDRDDNLLEHRRKAVAACLLGEVAAIRTHAFNAVDQSGIRTTLAGDRDAWCGWLVSLVPPQMRIYDSAPDAIDLGLIDLMTLVKLAELRGATHQFEKLVNSCIQAQSISYEASSIIRLLGNIGREAENISHALAKDAGLESLTWSAPQPPSTQSAHTPHPSLTDAAP